MNPTLARIVEVYTGSDGDATRHLYAGLEIAGPDGALAANLLRAAKTSGRAKRYGRSSSKHAAYETKEWAMANACQLLREHGARKLGVGAWGWGIDERQAFHRFVLYLELPTGQVSFHTALRGAGPDYCGQWDGARGLGADRIVRYAAGVLEGRPIGEEGEAIPPVRFLCDGERHLVCVPYSIDGLHAMAAELAIGEHWFHGGRFPHYDIPKGRLAEIMARRDVEVVTPREILGRIKAGLERQAAAEQAAPPATQERLL